MVLVTGGGYKGRCLQRMAVTTDGYYNGWLCYNGWLLLQTGFLTNGCYNGWLL